MDFVFLLETSLVVSVCTIWDSSDDIGEYSLVECDFLDFWYDRSDLLLVNFDGGSPSDRCLFLEDVDFFPREILVLSLTFLPETSSLVLTGNCLGAFRPVASSLERGFEFSYLSLSLSLGTDVERPLWFWKLCLSSYLGPDATLYSLDFPRLSLPALDSTFFELCRSLTAICLWLVDRKLLISTDLCSKLYSLWRLPWILLDVYSSIDLYST